MLLLFWKLKKVLAPSSTGGASSGRGPDRRKYRIKRFGFTATETKKLEERLKRDASRSDASRSVASRSVDEILDQGKVTPDIGLSLLSTPIKPEFVALPLLLQAKEKEAVPQPLFPFEEDALQLLAANKQKALKAFMSLVLLEED